MAKPMITIGALSRGSGVPIDTIRTWERRYRFPAPERTEAGQRLYPASAIDAVREARAAIESGLRPAQVFGPTSTSAASGVPTPLGPTSSTSAQSHGTWSPDHWLGFVRALDSTSLDHALHVDWNRFGALQFLQMRAAPFVRAVGEAWAAGTLGVYHEHFASDRLVEFLSDQWRRINQAASGPLLVASTLPTELHGVGLHMAAVAAAGAGCRILFLGTDTPVSEIAQAALQADAHGVLLSASAVLGTTTVTNQLRTLRRTLPPHVAIACGGVGAPIELEGVETFDSFDAFSEWCRHLAD